MKSAWIWGAAVVIIVAIGGLWWYAQSAKTPSAMAPSMGQEATSSMGDMPGMAMASQTPAQAVSARDNSDASLDADMSDINGQMTQLNADSQAAAQ